MSYWPHRFHTNGAGESSASPAGSIAVRGVAMQVAEEGLGLLPDRGHPQQQEQGQDRSDIVAGAFHTWNSDSRGEFVAEEPLARLKSPAPLTAPAEHSFW